MHILPQRVTKGFTLIELLVVLVIMSLITLAFLNNQSKFDSSTIMRSLAYSIALSIRQAQVYGTASVRSNNGTFSLSHGLYFSTSNTEGYTMYADTDQNNEYTTSATIPSGTDTNDQVFTINNEYAIVEECVVTNAGSKMCDGPDGDVPYSFNTLTVLFKRPDTDAQIYAYWNNDIINFMVSASNMSAYIKLEALNTGDTRFITVTNTGQVTVCAPGAIIGGAGC